MSRNQIVRLEAGSDQFLASDQQHCPNGFLHQPACRACLRQVQRMASATVASASTQKALRDGPRGPRLGLVVTAHRITHPLREPRPTPAPLLCPVRLGFERSVRSFSRRADSGRVVRPLRPMFTMRVSLFQTCVPKVSFIEAIWKVPLGSKTLCLTISAARQQFHPVCLGIGTASRYARISTTWRRTLLGTHPPSCFPHLVIMWPLFSVTPGWQRALLDEKNKGPLTALHVSKRGIFRSWFQNLGETLLGVL